MITQQQVLSQILLEVSSQTSNDPLINSGAETTIKITVFAMILIATAMIGFFSRRLEHTLAFAIVTSAIAIAFFIIH